MRALAAIAAVLTFGLCQHASAGHGGLGGLSLRPTPSVKAISMGETGLTDPDNAPGFAMNPASTPFILKPQVSLGYGTLVEGLSASQTTVAAVLPLGSEILVPGLGITVRRFGMGVSFDHRSLELSQGSGWSSETVSLGFGYRITPYASLGLLSKLLFSNTDLEGAGAKAFGIDLTVLLDINRSLSLGLALRNLGATASWEDGEDESLPLLFSLGGRVALPRNISTELTMTASDADRTKGGLGFNVPILDTGFSLRIGYLYHSGDYSRNIPTFGFGFNYTSFQLDYAARIDDDTALGTTHHFSLAYGFR
jgi:hypothetical protein